jgi:exodeoxyribonuclease VII small subunit
MAKFEDCLKRLEEIVDRLEKGDLALEESLALFEEGMKLSNSCRGELEQAEGKVEMLLKQGSKLQPQPLEPGEEQAKAK